MRKVSVFILSTLFGFFTGIFFSYPFLVYVDEVEPQTFFGATVDGPIVPQFNGKMECAWVKFNDIRKCRCHINEHGWGWDHDKTFMISMNEKMCEETIK